MATIRLNKLCREFNISLATLTEYLRSIGYLVDENPNAKVDESCIQQVSTRFGRDLAMKLRSEKVRINVSDILSSGPTLPEEKDYEEMIGKQKKKIAPAREKVKANAPIYGSPKSPNGTISVSRSERKKTSTNPTVINDRMDWDIFSVCPSNQTVNETISAEREEWELSLEKAVMSIPSPVDETTKTRILSLVSDWLDKKNEATTSRNNHFSEEELLSEIISHVEIGDKEYLENLFANVEGRDIPQKRELLKRVLSQDAFVGKDFWFFINTVLTINADIYRAPICESVYRYTNVSKLKTKDDNGFNCASELLFRNQDKCNQAIQFFYPFRKNLPPIVRQDIMDATRYLSTIDDLELAFNILESDIQEKLYLLSVNDSLASQYLGFTLLRDYCSLNGKEAVERIAYFDTYMNCISGASPSWRLINKLVLGDNSEMTDEEANRLLKDGFNSFCLHIQKTEIKKMKKERTSGISDFIGKQIHFEYAGETQWNIFGGTDAGYGFILPKAWVSQPMVKKEWYYATAVKAVRSPNLLVLSQKTIKAGDLPKASTVHVGEIAEARFSLINDKIETSLIGHGPTQAILKKIPRNFEYKIKHQVKIVKVYDVNKCEIEVIQ